MTEAVKFSEQQTGNFEMHCRIHGKIISYKIKIISKLKQAIKAFYC